jgi:hypothetical protein
VRLWKSHDLFHRYKDSIAFKFTAVVEESRIIRVLARVLISATIVDQLNREGFDVHDFNIVGQDAGADLEEVAVSELCGQILGDLVLKHTEK